jgi:hypothetical protein
MSRNPRVVMTPLLFVGMVCVVFLRSYTLVRQVERGQKKDVADGKAEDESAEPAPTSVASVRDEEKNEVVAAVGEEKDERARGAAPAQA